MTPLVGSVAMMMGGKAAATPARTPAGPATTPKRINKCIELLEQGQPVYVTIGFGGYEEGKKMAQTTYDMIVYDMEHKPLNLTGLEAFMKGLKDGGPTKSGHLTPTVVPQLPCGGWDETTMQANYWMCHQVLDTGAHGVYLCHAGDPGAVRVVVRSCRYPFNRMGIDPELPEGRRGAGGEDYAAQMWNMPTREYIRRADLWPLNPEGELMIAIKCEDKYALTNCEKTCAVPGVTFAEWGPGDMGMSLGTPLSAQYGTIELRRAQARVFAAAKANHLYFLNAVDSEDIEERIQQGMTVLMCDEATIEKGRRFTKRTMPW
jgi:4-hydroxy-2-oxoheptanedioate aldolase